MSSLAFFGGNKTVPDGLQVRWPVITDEDKKAVLAVLERGTLWGALAPEATALQEEWAEYVGSKYCIALNSGTAALHCAIAAAGIGPGDEVITTAYSFLASATAIMHNNGVPIFVDIDPRTFNMDVKQVEAKITPRTKAIVVVDLHGLPADYDELSEIANRHKIILIEDSCQAHGSFYKGVKAGKLGVMGAFSLNTTKNLPGGEGGLFVTDSDEYLGKANMTRIFGEYIEPGKGRSYKAYTLGWNYRTQEMPAAFARSQLKRLDHYVNNAQENGQYLTDVLNSIPGINPPYIPNDRTTNYHKFRVVLDQKELGIEVEPTVFRDQLMAALKAEGVSVALWQTFPLPANPLFQVNEGYGKKCPFECPHYGRSANYDPNNYPVTWHIANNSFVVCEETFPIYPQPLELMKYYGEAFEKVFKNLDEVLKIEVKPSPKVADGRAERV